ncbi:hypothetical protein KQ940_17715 [Marinobacterium sp. D7]|uniref:hypothetical protein n=1 Tax=Marinobacterium ramblicola TaxID=2849041 RepID=UPI001C2DDA78|nr:hypothetical protein [Marinobacterium ramblicola]MBV1789898.1 hypothetical protein [Marinobacterium ramblicola]
MTDVERIVFFADLRIIGRQLDEKKIQAVTLARALRVLLKFRHASWDVMVLRRQ